MATGLIGVLMGAVLAIVPTQPAIAATGINKQINFQGKVVNSNGTNVANGSYTFVFKLYTVASGGAAVWTESKSLTVTDGIFVTALGDTTALPGSVDFNTDNIFLGMAFNSDPEMTPRIQFTAAAYAFNADKLDGLDSTQLARTDAANTFTGTSQLFKNSANSATSFQVQPAASGTSVLDVDTQNARVGVNTNAPAYALDVVGDINTSTGYRVGGVAGVSQSCSAGNYAVTGTLTGGISTGTATCFGTGSFINNTTTNQAAANFNIQSAAVGSVTGVLKDLTSQTADLLEFQDASANVMTSVDTTGYLHIQRAGASTDNVLTARVTADANDRFTLGADGKLSFGSGAGAADVTISRTGAGALTVGGSLTAAGLTSTSGASLGGATVGINRTTNANTFINDNATNTGTVTIGGGNAPLVIDSTNFDVTSAGALSGISTIATSGAINSQTISNAASFTGTLTTAGKVTVTAGGADIAGAVTVNSTISGGTTYTASTALQAPVIDTASAVGLAIGGTNASSVTLGRTATTFTIQGNQSATITSTNSGSGFKTTVGFTPTTGSNKAINFPDEAGTLCIQGSSNCGFAVGTFLAKNAQDTSTASVAGTLYSFSNTSTGSTSTLALSNAGTGSTLDVTTSANPTSGNAVIVANNNNGTPSGNLLDLKAGGTSKLAVDVNGRINGQTISSSASFTGTVATASTLTVSAGGLAVTGNSTIAGTLGGVTNLTLSGTISGGTTYSATTAVQAPSFDAPAVGALNIGTTNASSVTIGKTASNFLLQGASGASGSAITATNGANTTSLIFTDPTAARSIVFPDAGGTVCTTTATTCSATYQVAGSYLAKNAADTSSASYLGTLLGLTNSNTGTSGVLSLTGAGTSSALSVTSSGNPTSGNALILANNTSGAASGNLLDLEVGGVSKLAVDFTGKVNGQTISSSANFTGTVTTGGSVTITSGGIDISGGGIINTGAVTGVTTLSANNTLTLSGTGANQLAVTGAPAASATSSLVQFGGAIAGGNATALTGGTYVGINAPAAGAGSTADFLNFQSNGTSKLKVSAAGLVNAAGGYAVNGTAGASATCSAGEYVDAQVSNGGLLTGGTCTPLPGSSSANQQLSNLSGTVAVNLSLTPGADNSINVGSASFQWANGYFGTSLYSPALERATSGALAIGTTANTTSIALGNSGAVLTSASQLKISGVTNDITTGTNEDLTLAPNGTGKVALTALGSADTSTLLCRNTSGQIATCSATLNGSAFVQSGNSFSVTAILGTNDAQDLEIETSNTTRLTFGAGGGVTLAANNNLSTASGTGTITQNYSNTSGTGTTLNATNSASSGTTTLNAQAINLTGTNNAAGSNTITGLNFGNVSAATNNTYYGIQFGTGFNDLIRYNGTQILSGAGKLQNAGLDSTLTYSNITGVGALVNGSIASGFGTIATGNTITGTALNGTTGINTGAGAGTQRIDNSGNLLNIGNVTGAGAISVTSGTNADLTLAGGGTGQIVLNDLIQAPTLGTANTSTLLCRNSSNQIATCSATLSGSAFVQDGNSFGTTATLGTNDVQDLALETSNTARLTIAAAGGVTVASGNDLTVAGGALTQSGGAVSLNNASNNNTSINTGGSTGTVTIGGGSAPLVINSTNFDVSAAGVLSGITGLTVASGGASISGGINNNAGGVSGAGAIAGATTIDANNKLTLSGTGAVQVAVTGAPATSATSSLVQLGTAISGGSANGTFLGLNAASGYTGDLLNLQVNNASKLKVSDTGLVDSAVGFAVAGTSGSTITACAAGEYVATFSSSGGIVTGGTCTTIPGASSANQQLSNLSGTVAVNLSLTPGADNTIDIGSGSFRWRSGYFGTSVVTPSIVAAAATDITINAGTTGAVKIGGTSTGDIEIGGGSGSTGCTVTNASGNLACTGTVNGATISGGTLSGGTVSGGTLTAIAVNGLNVSSSAVAVAAAATDLTVDAGTTGSVSIGATSTGDILLGGGSASTGCTVVNASGNLVCAGTINGATISGGTVSGGALSGGTVSGGTVSGGSLTATAVNGLNVSSTAVAVAAAATGLTVDAGTTGTISIGATSTGDILLGGGSGSTGCTVTNASGNLACTGTLNGATVSGGALSGGTFSGGSVSAGTISGGTLTATAVNGLNVSSTAVAVSTAATGLTLNAGTTGTVSIGGTSTGDILLGGGSGSTGCTVTNASGNLACTGTINGSTLSGGTVSGGTLSGGTVSGGTLSATAVNGLNVSSSAVAVAAAATDLTVDAGTTGSVSIGATSTGDILLGGGSGSTGCTVVNASGNLVCAGTINGATISGGTVSGGTLSGGSVSGGTVSGGTLSATAVNNLSVSGTAVQGTGSLTIDGTGAGTVSIGGTSTGDILLGGGSGSTGCTITNASGNLACTGTVNSASISGGTLSGGTISGGTVSGGSLTAAAVNGLNVSSAAIAVAASGTDLTVDAGTTGQVNIGGNSTGDILLGGGSGSTGCTVTNASGNLACTGTINGQTLATNSIFSGTVSAVTGFRINGAATTGTFLRGNGTNYVASTLQATDGTGLFVKTTPTATSDNTVNPGANAAVALTLRGSSDGSNPDILDIRDSGNVLQSYFAYTGAFVTSQAISAPTSSNTINGVVINSGALSSVTAVTASGTIQGATLNATTAIQANGAAGLGGSCAAGEARTGATYTMGILTTAGSCTSVSAGTYLAKNAQDTSSAAVNGGYLYAFTNSGTGAGTGVLSLTNSNAAGTGSVLSVSSAANAASGQALILANATNGTPTGNLLDLQVSSTSKFSVSVAGVTTLAGSQTADITVASAAAASNGNSLTLVGGTAGSGNQNGGATTIKGGTGTGTGTGGAVNINGGAASSTGAGGAITIQAANGGGSAANGVGPGGNITLQAGSAAVNNNAGGSITLSAGAATGTGTPGVVSIGTPVFTSASETYTQTGNNQSFTASQTNLDAYGTIVMTVAGAYTGATVTMPSPSNTAAGRIILVSAATGSVSFTLAATGMSSVNMSAGNTATLVWNGSGWSGTTTASSLQQVYNNTSTSPASIITTSASKNILLQAGVGYDNANVFQIGNSAAAPVLAIDTTNTATGLNLADNGALETGSGTTGWSAFAGTGSGSITRNTVASKLASGLGSLDVSITGTGTGGAQNDLNAAALASSQIYNVSFNVKSSSGTPTIAVQYYRDNTSGGTLDATCSVPTNGTVSSSGFFKYTCTFTTTASGNTKATTNFLRISKTDATTIADIYIDNLAVVAQNTTGTQNTGNLQVGGPLSQGLTLLTLDSFAGVPFTGTSNQNLLGSMYYDTTVGRMQCYESDGWGSCGAAPNNSVEMTPEYPGAVLNTGASSSGANWTSSGNVGIMTANLCSGTSRLSINTSICGATDDFNYYQWTTSQTLTQSYAVYARYQLPPTFKNFYDDNTISLAARTTSTTDAKVWFSLYKPDGSICGSETDATPSASTWATTSLTGTETTCGFVAGNIMTFRIEMLAKNNATVYASNLSFTMTGK